MLGLFLAPFYIALNLYVAFRILRWLNACCSLPKLCPFKWILAVCHGFLALSPLIAFLLPSSEFQRFIAWLSSFWLGFFLYAVLLILAADCCARILNRLFLSGLSPVARNRIHARIGVLLAVLLISLCTYGVVHAGNIKIAYYSLHLDGLSKELPENAEKTSLRIVLVADFHLGYSVGAEQMQQMVEKINAQHPDLVCIAGDIFDNSYEALKDPERLTEILSQIESPLGVYACYGNHDVSERLLAGFRFPSGQKNKEDSRMDLFLSRSGIHLLRDQFVQLDESFFLIGRRDASSAGRRKTVKELMAQLPEGGSNLPVIVLDHQPNDLDELASGGAALVLSGHTHDGQLFPANLLIKAAWENPRGLLKKDGMYSIVTSGVGVWGPNMRILTDSEIAVIDVTLPDPDASAAASSH